MSSLTRSLVLAAVLVGGVTACLPERNSQKQFEQGMAYEKGDGVPKDDAQAVTWYRKAAEQGYTDAELWWFLVYGGIKGVAYPAD